MVDLKLEKLPAELANSVSHDVFLWPKFNIIKGVPLATKPGIEDVATKFEQEYSRCVRNEEECVCSAPNCCNTEQQSA